MKATVEVADPKTHRSEIESFEGILNIGREPITLTGVIFLRIHFSTVPSGINFVPRGSLIYNADMVFGIVVYTGDDTKVAYHLKKDKETWQKERVPIMDDMTDKVFLALIYLIFGLSILFEIVQHFRDDHENEPFEVFEWVTVLQKCIPISLVLLLEVLNYIITYRITKDKKSSPFSHKVCTIQMKKA